MYPTPFVEIAPPDFEGGHLPQRCCREPLLPRDHRAQRGVMPCANLPQPRGVAGEHSVINQVKQDGSEIRMQLERSLKRAERPVERIGKAD